MSALFNSCPRGEYGQILAIQGDGPPDFFANGLPFEAGRLAIDIGPTNPRWHQGLPLTPNGRIACGNLSPTRFNSGSMPLTPAGRLAVDVVEARPVNRYVNPELAGGAASGPADGSNPPTDHSIIFNNIDSGPIDNGDGTFTWGTNPDADTGRCPLAYDLKANNPDLVVGTRYEASWDAENLSDSNYKRVISLQGQADVEILGFNQTVGPNRRGRVFVAFRPLTAAWNLVVRMGTGTTSSNNQTFRFRNPTLYDLDASPYPESVAHGVNYADNGAVQMEVANLEPPIFRDTFNGTAGTDLVDHTPDVGGPWEALGGILRISDAQSAQANGTGTGAGSPTYWSRTFNTAAVSGRKRITWRASSGSGGTSLVQGVFLLSDAAGNNKVTFGLVGNSFRIQLWEGGNITGTENLGALPESPGNTGEFEWPFYLILDGTTVTYGYGNPSRPEIEVTRAYPQFAGNHGMGVIMRTSTSNGIYEITYQDW